jgi:ligand-binding sensor domain-containing protein/two-component sensor histidine kinase
MRSFSLLVIFLLSFLCSFAQEPNRFLATDILAQSSIFQWTGQNGLVSNNITSSIQTQSGSIWITTYNGLMRFDGRKVEIFDRNTLPFLATDAFYDVYEDKTGKLWFASQGSGLITYDGDKFSIVEPKNKKIPRSIRSLFFDDDGNVWIGSNNEGLLILSNNELRELEDPLLKNITILDIAHDEENNYWFATDGRGVLKYDGKTVQQFTNEHGLFSNSVNTLKVLENTILVGTTLGLNRIADNKVSEVKGVRGSPVNDIALGPDGLIWIATENELIRYGDYVVDSIGEKEGPFTRINGISFDMEGNIWLSTGRNGLIQIKQTGILNFGSAQGLSSSRINIIVEGPNQEFYIGSDGGDVDIYKDDKLKRLPLKTSLNNAGIRDVCIDDEGNIWIASYSGIIKRSPNGSEKLYGLAEGLPAIDMRRILKDKKGNLWFGTRSGGVIKFSNNKITAIYNKENGLGSNYILSMEEDGNGNIYVGTHSGGLTIIKPDGTTKHLSIKDDDAGILLFNIHIAKDSSVWVVANSGTYYLNGERFIPIQLDGLNQGETFFDLLEDSQGDFWITANIGIFKLKREHVDAFVGGKAKSIPAKLFDNQDGMINKECTGATRSLVSSKGRLWIPTIGGVSVFQPDRITENKIIPPVYVTDLICDKTTFKGDSAIIEPGNLRYTFNFTALSYWSPGKVKFKYQLVGVDPEWVNSGGVRHAEYTNLKPGKYTFRVIACNNDGVWNTEGAAMFFEVKPFFYQTAWFYILGIAIGLVILYGTYKWRVYSVEKRNAELRKLNSELDRFVYSTSHDLRAPLASILGLINLSRLEEKNKDHYLALIEKSVHKLDEFISEIIDYSRNARLAVEPVAIDFQPMITSILEDLEYLEENVTLKKNISISSAGVFHSDKTRIRIILSNLISNAIKYHNNRQANPFIDITINANEQHALITVADNGIGIRTDQQENIFKMFHRGSEQSKGSGLGLYIVKETISKLGGSIAVKSKLGEGTTFEVILPGMNFD